MPNPSIVSLILGVLGVGGAVLGTLLATKGKREDTKQVERKQAFDEIVRLADVRLEEINRLNTLVTALEAKVEAVRTSWEERWHRQMVRCRDVTEPLVTMIGMLQKEVPRLNEAADKVKRDVDHHNEDDHSA